MLYLQTEKNSNNGSIKKNSCLFFPIYLPSPPSSISGEFQASFFCVNLRSKQCGIPDQTCFDTIRRPSG